ncbi:MAG: hypothetical protein JRE24_07670 [Deltaproteobacteria bacterium]|nr:hypothetical protein [Deltaproteobacteria bacterium]
MKHTRILLVCLSVMVVCLSSPLTAEINHRCIKCHSKRPGAVAMHEALKNQDCYDCHVRGEKLRQKGGIPNEKHEAFLKQRLADPRCTRCHGKKKSEVSKEGEAKHQVPLSGRTFCPKCQVVGDKDWKMCPKCGGSLIDLDRIMRLSAVHPDQALCRKCHFMEGELQKRHVENAGEKFESEQNCLECHEGHKECSGCHE